MDTCTGQLPAQTANTHTLPNETTKPHYTRAHAHWCRLTTTGSLSFLIKLINARTCELPATAAGTSLGRQE